MFRTKQIKVYPLSVMAISLLSALVVGCTSKNTDPQTIHPQRLADPIAAHSFAVVAQNPDSEKTNTDEMLSASPTRIILKKAALGKAFLLSPVVVIATNNPIIDHLAPKIVAFELSGKRLALFELNKDAVYKNLRSDRLLETFDVLEEDTDSVSFSWKFGLSAVPFQSFLAGGATDLPAFKIDSSKTPVLPADKTFVRSAEVAHGTLEIEQISEILISNMPLDLQSMATAFLTGSGLTLSYDTMTVRLNVSIRPYVQNRNYEKRSSPFHDGIGAFETAITRETDGKIDFYASLWDAGPGRAPITYAITKGTPEKYLKPIREGILYWNKVAGRELVKVETEADPEAAPVDRKVLVHWIPWDRAGFARASFQSDPLTGEIYRADVYLTSAFAKGAGMGIRRAIENWVTAPGLSLSLIANQFRPSELCRYEKPFLASARADFMMQGNGDMIEKFIADDLREVTAHEVGHTLGMRHNFAGSLETDLHESADRVEVEKKYIAGQLPGGLRVSSSVMDYIFGIPGGMLGAFIENEPLTYDSAFIQWAYNGGALSDHGKNPAFCSDGRADSIPGCRRGDNGKSTIAGAAETLKDNVRTLENLILQNVVMLFHPKNPRDRIDKWQVMAALSNVDLNQVAQIKSADLAQVRTLISENSEDFAIELMLGKRSWFNEKVYDRTIEKKIATELASVGGLDGFLAQLFPMDANLVPKKGWLKERLNAIYARPDFKSGNTFEGVPYTLTKEEDAFIGELIEGFADKAEEAWLNALVTPFMFKPPKEKDDNSNVITALLATPESSISPYAGQDQWWPKLASLAENVMTLRSGSTTGSVNDQPVELPKAAYSVELRKAVVVGCVPDNYRLHSLEKVNLKHAKENLLLRFREVFAKEFKNASELKEHAKTLKMNFETRKWLKDELALLTKIEAEL